MPPQKGTGVQPNTLCHVSMTLFILCLCNMIPARSEARHLHFPQHYWPFTSLPTPPPQSTSHPTTPVLFFSSRNFINNLISICRSYHLSPTSSPPGHAYVWVNPTLPLSTSEQCFLDYTSAVAPVCGVVTPWNLLKSEDELAAMQALWRQNYRSEAEVRALGQPNGTKMSTLQVPHSDLIAWLACAW